MNKASAMKVVDVILKNEFKYLNIRQNISIDVLHLTFKMDSGTHNLQMTFRFDESYVDILCFVSPRMLTQDDEHYFEALRSINYINLHVKAWGRYYIDNYYDIAYSLRLDYNVLEIMPHECVKEIECAVDYYADLFILLINVCQGKISYEDTKEYIDAMWRGDDTSPD